MLSDVYSVNGKDASVDDEEKKEDKPEESASSPASVLTNEYNQLMQDRRDVLEKGCRQVNTITRCFVPSLNVMYISK